MSYKNKYLKYKTKYINSKSLIGGEIKSHEILKKIKSIGFEFETKQMAFFYLYDDDKKKFTSLSYYALKNSQISPQLISDINDTNFIFSINTDTPVISDNSSVFDINRLLKTLNKEKINIGEYTSTIEGPKFKNSAFKHSEFHITYKNINSNSNCIYFYLYDACNKISNLFKKLDKVENQKIVINTDPIIDESEYIISSKATVYNENDRRIYIIPNLKEINNIETINWVIQMTIGIQIENYITIVNYLLFKEKYTNNNWENAKNVSNKIYNSFLDFIKLKSLHQHKFNDLDLIKILNFITIIIYENQLIKYPNDNRYGWNIGVDKNLLSVIIRHDYDKIYPIINNDLHLLWVEFINLNLVNMTLINTHVDILLKNTFKSISNNKLEFNLPVYDENKFIMMSKHILQNYATHYEYSNNILLLEFRSFYKYLSINSNISEKNLKLSLLIPFLESKNSH